MSNDFFRNIGSIGLSLGAGYAGQRFGKFVVGKSNSSNQSNDKTEGNNKKPLFLPNRHWETIAMSALPALITRGIFQTSASSLMGGVGTFFLGSLLGGAYEFASNKKQNPTEQKKV